MGGIWWSGGRPGRLGDWEGRATFASLRPTYFVIPAKAGIQRLTLRCTEEAGFVAASHLPVWFRDLATYSNRQGLLWRF